MADRLKLEILTPREKVLSTETPWVTLPGALGEMGVLHEHIPLVTTVDTGVLSYEEDGKKKKAAVHYGYAQVQGDHVTVLTEMVELGDHVDLARAKDAEQRAREALQKIIADESEAGTRMNKFEAKLQRALVRQMIGG